MNKHLQRGFTLFEALVALAVITVISMVVVGALAPWIGLKQSMDNDRKMQEVRTAFLSYYEANAFAVDSQANGQFAEFRNSTVSEARQCNNQEAAFAHTSFHSYLVESAAKMALDGYANPWCFFISDAIPVTREGVTFYYRNVAIVSMGRDGELHGDTRMVNGQLQLAADSDDVGVVVSGFDVQLQKVKETMRRMNRVASMYETYFTTRYLAYPDRDIRRYYFSKAGDTTGAVNSTGGTWQPARTLLADIGVGAPEALSAWETANGVANDIQVANYNETVNGLRVRSPNSTTGTGALPYTALLRARIPTPPTVAAAYISQVVVGNY